MKTLITQIRRLANDRIEFTVERGDETSHYWATHEPGPVIPLLHFDDGFYRDFGSAPDMQEAILLLARQLFGGDRVDLPMTLG